MSAEKKGGIRRKLTVIGLGLLLVGACGYGGVHMVSESRLGRTFEVEAENLEIPAGGGAVERGRYLVDHLLGCKECHGPDLGGKVVMDNGAMGRWYGPNLTAGQGSVVKDYTGRDWARSLRHGVARDGRRQFLMPSEDYVSLSDADLGAVAAYVRSVAPVDRPSEPVRLGPIARLLVATGEISFGFDKIDHKASRPSAAPGANREWGAVLVSSCTGCHGKGLSGGKIPGGDPSWPEATNITPDTATGIGKWTYADFEKSMREGKRPDGSTLREPMPWAAYAGLKDEDLKAMWEYLRSVQGKQSGGR